MNPKIAKINTEYEKNAIKLAHLQERQQELEKERTELENLDIIGIVRGLKLTPDELAELLGGAAPAQNDTKDGDYSA